MQKKTETQKPPCSDDRLTTFERSEILELLGNAGSLEGFTLEWMLRKAEQDGGRL